MAFKLMELFHDMLSSETWADGVTMVAILTAFLEFGILQPTVCLHGYITVNGFNNNIFVGASLIEFYSKCGSIDKLQKYLMGVMNKDVVVWNLMIVGYGIDKQGMEALKTFDLMVKNAAFRPNNVTFLSIIAACSHVGLVVEEIEILNMMSHEYQPKPVLKHYGILADLLGWTGELDKAMDIINQMLNPVGPHVWGAFLGAHRIHHNLEIGEIVAKTLLELDPNHANYYIVLSHIYVVDEKWECVVELSTQIKEKVLKKAFGQSLVVVRNEVHIFVFDDRFHLATE